MDRPNLRLPKLSTLKCASRINPTCVANSALTRVLTRQQRVDALCPRVTGLETVLPGNYDSGPATWRALEHRSHGGRGVVVRGSCAKADAEPSWPSACHQCRPLAPIQMRLKISVP